MNPALLKRSILTVLIITALFLLTSGWQNANASTKTLKSVKDASVRSKSSSTNVNTESLEVAYDEEIFLSDDKRASYVQFDISSLPSNAIINSAKLRLYQTSHSLTDNTVTIDAIRVISEWSETGVKWSNKPSTYNPTASKSVTETATWVEWTVTNTVKGWKDGTYSNYGFEISGKDQSSDYFLKFSSRESDKDPELVIDYDVPIDFNIGIINPNLFDLTAPEISDIKVKDTTDTSAKITWKTNEDTDGFVDYDTDTSYDKTANGELDTKDHELSLYDLEPETKYHYRVRAKDAAGNETKASDKTFTTLEQEELSPAAPQQTPTPTPTPTSVTQEVEDEAVVREETGSSEEPQESATSTPESAKGDETGSSKYVRVEDLMKYLKIGGIGLGIILIFIIGILLGKKLAGKGAPHKTAAEDEHAKHHHTEEEEAHHEHKDMEEPPS